MEVLSRVLEIIGEYLRMELLCVIAIACLCLRLLLGRFKRNPFTSSLLTIGIFSVGGVVFLAAHNTVFGIVGSGITAVVFLLISALIGGIVGGIDEEAAAMGLLGALAGGYALFYLQPLLKGVNFSSFLNDIRLTFLLTIVIMVIAALACGALGNFVEGKNMRYRLSRRDGNIDELRKNVDHNNPESLYQYAMVLSPDKRKELLAEAAAKGHAAARKELEKLHQKWIGGPHSEQYNYERHKSAARRWWILLIIAVSALTILWTIGARFTDIFLYQYILYDSNQVRLMVIISTFLTPVALIGAVYNTIQKSKLKASAKEEADMIASEAAKDTAKDIRWHDVLIKKLPPDEFIHDAIAALKQIDSSISKTEYMDFIREINDHDEYATRSRKERVDEGFESKYGNAIKNIREKMNRLKPLYPDDQRILSVLQQCDKRDRMNQEIAELYYKPMLTAAEKDAIRIQSIYGTGNNPIHSVVLDHPYQIDSAPRSSGPIESRSDNSSSTAASSASPTRVRDEDGNVSAYIKDEIVRDVYGNWIGNIRDGKLFDNGGNYIGEFRGNHLYDAHGVRQGEMRGNRFYDEYGNWKYTVE